MHTGLLIAAGLTIAIGLVHSVLGERYILIRLFRRDNLPRLFGSDVFTKRTLRFAWHVTSVAWWGLAAVLLLSAGDPVPGEAVRRAVGVTFLITGVIAAVGSRGKHFAWPVFLAIGALAWLAG